VTDAGLDILATPDVMHESDASSDFGVTSTPAGKSISPTSILVNAHPRWYRRFLPKRRSVRIDTSPSAVKLRDFLPSFLLRGMTLRGIFNAATEKQKERA
jgi:hypothetical protein